MLANNPKNLNLKGTKYDYTGGVDFGFLKAHDVKVVKHQPWQLGLFHPDLKGKFVWYPRKGTLMFEWEFQGERHVSKMDGSFIAGGHEAWRSASATERVYKEIMSKINEQQDAD